MKTASAKWRILLMLAVVAVTSGSARADQLRFESGEKRVSFVELFTSEGCSCPTGRASAFKTYDASVFVEDICPGRVSCELLG